MKTNGDLTARDTGQTPELLTVPEAAAFLRVQPSTIRAWILQRRIAFVRLGGRAIRFRRSDLSALVSASIVPAGSVQ